MKFSPADYTFNDFINATQKVMGEFNFISHAQCLVEDSVPWIEIQTTKAIKPKEALQVLEKLQASITDEILFHSLNGKRMRIVVNGKFHIPEEERYDFDEDYANDFGVTIDEMKKDYGLI